MIQNPDVFKSPSSDNTYVIFGEAKIEDMTNAALSKEAERLVSNIGLIFS